MTEISVLEEFGLSEAEAKVYITLLEAGSTLAGPIIKKTGFHRGTTYLVLQRLKEKGLASSVIKGKKQYFEAADPDRLLSAVKEREERLRGILPILKSKLQLSREKQEVTVYSGIKGIHSVMDKMLEELRSNGEYFDFGVSGLFRNIMGAYWDIWQRKKREYKIRSHVIFTEELKNSKLLQDYHGKARFHPKEYPSITDTMIYKDTVIIFIWTAKPPIAIYIKNKDNAESYKNQFKLMWKQAKK